MAIEAKITFSNGAIVINTYPTWQEMSQHLSQVHVWQDITSVEARPVKEEAYHEQLQPQERQHL